MHFPNVTAAISSLLMVTVSASTPASFSVPDEGDIATTTVFETFTFYVTSTITVPTPVASVSGSISAPANSSAAAPSPSYAVPPVPANSSAVATTTPPAERTPTQSLYVTGSQTFVPVTLWKSDGTTVIYPQNSTALDIPTGYPTNGTAPSTVVTTTSAASTAVTTFKYTAATVLPSAIVSEVATNGAGKLAEGAVLGMGLIAGLMTFL